MDLEKFRASWSDPEFVAGIERMVAPETPLELKVRLRAKERRERRWKGIRQGLIRSGFGLVFILMTALRSFGVIPG
jgi:hypothetical protein